MKSEKALNQKAFSFFPKTYYMLYFIYENKLLEKV